MMVKSTDACLIQYAIQSKGIIQDEAIKQAFQYDNRLWFTDK